MKQMKRIGVLALLLLSACSNNATTQGGAEKLTLSPDVALQAPPSETGQTRMEARSRLVLYELDPAWFERKTSEIPGYSKGDIIFYEQGAVDSFNQGHSVTWHDPLVQTLQNLANLIPYDYLRDAEIGEQLSRKPAGPEETRKIITHEGVMFTQMIWNKAGRTAEVEVSVPDGDYYQVFLRSGTDSDIMIIQKIIWMK
ncbi:hypothetical protein [Paenibacillus borealis]|uniref:Lipoprotein n=1 Tax=Paenibacillus borealis TaxID=160799 RepID=A0A089L9Q2_PAEBO|nr:hypothetical protein [Paenibacillus borealis]AIQ55868.1 hypothetical protein PBOR_01985 [Paenibacillus borealis]